MEREFAVLEQLSITRVEGESQKETRGENNGEKKNAFNRIYFGNDIDTLPALCP